MFKVGDLVKVRCEFPKGDSVPNFNWDDILIITEITNGNQAIRCKALLTKKYVKIKTDGTTFKYFHENALIEVTSTEIAKYRMSRAGVRRKWLLPKFWSTKKESEDSL